MDGAWRQNELIGHCHMVDRTLELPDDVIVGPDGYPWVSTGTEIIRIGAPWFSPAHSIVTIVPDKAGALLLHSDGSLVIGVSGRGLAIDGADGTRRWISEAADRPITCVTAIAEDPAGNLWVTEGAVGLRPEQWVEDLMSRGSSGRLIKIDWASGSAQVIADKLAWPYGVVADDSRHVIYSESWRHRLMLRQTEASSRAESTIVLENMPAYPARIIRAHDGGFWLSLFAPRSQLVEFVLTEADFLKEMIRTVPPRYWVAPALASADDYREPLQAGAIKQLGMKKPFSPPRSYGLVVKLDANFRPLKSLHSRADGKRHGITGLRAIDANNLFILSKGNGKLVLAGPEVLSQ
jgi:sugar lactone lactonase YvrE